MEIRSMRTNKKAKAYAKIGWEHHQEQKGLYLYLIKSDSGGAGSISNGTSVEWLSSEVKDKTDWMISNDYTWVRSDSWQEEKPIETNEDALMLLEEEDSV